MCDPFPSTERMESGENRQLTEWVVSGRLVRMSTQVEPASLGAYGLRIRGLEQARSLLVPAADDWPAFELVNRVESGPYPEIERVSSTRASLRLQTGGRVTIDRDAGRAMYVTPRRLGDD